MGAHTWDELMCHEGSRPGRNRHVVRCVAGERCVNEGALGQPLLIGAGYFAAEEKLLYKTNTRVDASAGFHCIQQRQHLLGGGPF